MVKMGKSSNSHSKKNKETQSPILKIFKDIIQKEHNDQEKATLVKEKKREKKKKRKYYSSLQSKSDQEETKDVFFQRSAESSAAEKGKKDVKYAEEDRARTYSGSRTRSIPFQSEKRESWWLWGEPCYKKQEQPSTCSCRTCHLKKILSNEYACIGCLILVFTISVIVAFMLVFKSMAIVPDTSKMTEKLGMKNKFLDSNSMTEKLKKLQDMKTEDDYKKMDFSRNMRRSIWDSNLKNLEARLSESDFGDNSFQDSNGLVQSSGQISDLSSVLDTSKINDAQVSPRLKNFYKKLMETDAQIRQLKKGIYDNPGVTIVGDKNGLYRLKRSLLHHHKHKAVKGHEVKEAVTTTLAAKEKDVEAQVQSKENAVTKASNKEDQTEHHKKHLLDGILEIKDKEKAKKGRFKRLDNSTEPRGIMFEKKQLIVQYLDNQPKFPKCSHTQKDVPHEKHPFYKSSQQLNELLDEFMDKNLHEIVSEQLEIDKLLNKELKSKNPKAQHHEMSTRHPTTEHSITSTSTPTTQTTANDMLYRYSTERLFNKYLRPNMAKARKLKTELTKFLKTDGVTTKRDYFRKRVVIDDDSDIDYATTPAYDVVLSISTLMNPEYQKGPTNYASNLLLAKLPVRRLMQSDDEDEQSIGYEDFKEVLSDDMATHYENDRQVERRRREDNAFEENSYRPIKYNPPGVFNPNWKGPSPLYPDEVNSMIKQQTQETKPAKANYAAVTDSNEGEYVDYAVDNSDTVKMAQAYSDYGVLNEKKDNLKNEKSHEKNDRSSKMFTESMTTQADRRKRDYTLSTESTESHQTVPEKLPIYDSDNSVIDLLIKESLELLSNMNDSKINLPSKTRRKRSVYTENDNPVTNAITIIKNLSEMKSGPINDTKSVNELKENITDNVKKLNRTEEQMGASEFFALLSRWFSNLAAVSEDSKDQIETKVNSIMKLTNNISAVKNNTKDIMYPMYDSDMIENIGHRSRVLLSIEDENSNKNDNNKEDRTTERSILLLSSTDMQTIASNFTTQNDTYSNSNQELNKTKNMEENLSIVKRSVYEEPNVAFWNDMYDEDYGIKIDPQDNIMTTTRSFGEEVVQKSAEWIQDKVKMMSDSIKKKSREELNKFYMPDTKVGKIEDFGANLYAKDHSNVVPHKMSKREDSYDMGEKKPNFAMLTAHMQEVCKQASQAVQQTRNIRQNEDRDSQLASGMMQQLIKLMSELVDYEVQQKTCLKLPSDLKDFLEWLTMPVPTQTQKNVKIMPLDDAEHVLDLVTTSSSEKEDAKADTRSECLGTLHAVEDLMHEYTLLSDEDKSKVGGIKEYLEDQLDFLNKQLSSIDEINLANIYAKSIVPFRFRRDADHLRSNKRNRKLFGFAMRRPRKLGKFLRNSGKKHTRTTPNSFESLQMSTDGYKKEKRDMKFESNKERKDAEETGNKGENNGFETKVNRDTKDFKTKEDLKGFFEVNDNRVASNPKKIVGEVTNYSHKSSVDKEHNSFETKAKRRVDNNLKTNEYQDRDSVNEKLYIYHTTRFATINDRADNFETNGPKQKLEKNEKLFSELERINDKVDDDVETNENRSVTGTYNEKNIARDNIMYGDGIVLKDRRNLQDVYYKAVEDAKKLTTVKDLHKNVDEFDVASEVRSHK